jgi:hypothetical protein
VAGREWRGLRLQNKKGAEKMNPYIPGFNEEQENRMLGILHQACGLTATALDGLQKNYYIVGGIGSAKRLTVYCYEDDEVKCGCFCGTLAQFESQVEEFHKDNPHHREEYLTAIEAIRCWRSARQMYPPDKKDAVKAGWARQQQATPTFCNQAIGRAVDAYNTTCADVPAPTPTEPAI